MGFHFVTRSATTSGGLLAAMPGAGSGALGAAKALHESTKPGITALVATTAGVGFLLAAMSPALAGLRSAGQLAVAALGCLLGTALSAAGANALNQWMERDRDALMKRTRGRPIPSGRASPGAVALLGWGLCIEGVLVLWVACGEMPALLSMVTIISYLCWYTPFKPVSSLATLVGAIPGAMPTLIGWTAGAGAGLGAAAGARALLDPAGWSFFALLFAWQEPHFLAIAWLYRDDYAAGGYAVLPVIDRQGKRTARHVLAWTAALAFASFLPAVLMPDRLGPVYWAVAGLGSGWFLVAAARLARTRADRDARRAFLASIVHLPALLMAMALDPVLGLPW